MNTAHPLYAGFVRHRAASQWIGNVIADACGLMGLRHEHFFESRRHGHDLAAFEERHAADFVTAADARIEQVRQLPPFRGFHVIRDPRDAITSAYFSHRNSHWFPAHTEHFAHQQHLREVPKAEGLMLEIDFSRRYLSRIAAWDYALPHVLEVRFEELTSRPYKSFLRIFEFLGLLDPSERTVQQQLVYVPRFALNKLYARHPDRLPIRWPLRRLPGKELVGVVYRWRFSRKDSGYRSRGEEDAHHHKRKGIAGDWKNHFEPAHIAHFKETYGDLVQCLGYESSEEWARGG